MGLKLTDIKQVMREHLLADAAVQTLVGEHVYGAHLDDTGRATVLQASPLVAFEVTGGRSFYSAPIASPVFELYGWSKMSQDVATRAYETAKESLQGAALSLDNVPVCGTAREVEAVQEGFLDKDRSWFARGRWVATMKEIQ